jgi:hypothetical protein
MGYDGFSMADNFHRALWAMKPPGGGVERFAVAEGRIRSSGELNAASDFLQ